MVKEILAPKRLGAAKTWSPYTRGLKMGNTLYQNFDKPPGHSYGRQW
jgi:hypothetical protein